MAKFPARHRNSNVNKFLNLKIRKLTEYFDFYPIRFVEIEHRAQLMTSYRHPFPICFDRREKNMVYDKKKTRAHHRVRGSTNNNC